MGIKTVVKRAIKRLALPPEEEKVVDAALADGEAIETTFEPAPATTQKGASAEDVQAKLAAQSQTGSAPPSDQATAIAPTAVPSSAAAPTGAQEATGKPGTLDIF